MIFVWLVFLVTRLWNLTLLPVFTDEANYIDWGWRELNFPHHLFYSLYDGKQPFLMWLFGWSQKLFSDPLFAGRFVSVLTGLLTLWGMCTLSKYLFDKRTAINASILYLSIPLFLLFDRQALMESSLAAVGIWSLYFLYKYLDLNKLRYLITLGIILGLGFFIKSSALLFIVTTGIVLIAKKKVDAIIPLLILATCMASVCFPLLMQPQFWATLSTNSRYSAGLLGPWWKNFTAITDIMFWQLTPLVYLALIWAVFKQKKYLVLLWGFMPLIFSGLTATYIVSRYVVPFLPPLLILVARLPRKYLAIVIIPAIILSAIQIFNPIQYFYTLKKVSQYSYIEAYVLGDASGYMTNVAVDRIKEISAGKPMALGLALFSGNPEVGLLIYLRNSQNIMPAYFDSQMFTQGYFKDYDCLKFDVPVYLASRSSDKAGLAKYFDDFEVLENPISNSKIYLSKLKENCVGKTLPLTLQRE